jgi:glycosyltransferase involved in cell wall biosynthesis
MNLLQLAKKMVSRGHQVAFLSATGGPILDEFRKVGDTVVLRPIFSAPQDNSSKTLVKRRVREFQNQWTVGRLLKAFQPEVCYMNTLACWNACKYLADWKCPKIVHVNELEWVIEQFCGRHNSKQLLGIADGIVACSEEVAANLNRSFDLMDKPVLVQRSFIDPTELSEGTENQAGESFRRNLGIEPSDFVVGCLGAADWRKGIDLFVPLAKAMIEQNPNAKFVWMGYFEGRTLLPSLQMDIAAADLQRSVFLENPRKDYQGFLATIDAYASLAREDPYPLSVLSAGFFEKPVVCFDRSGGIPEFARQGAGIVVPYLSINHFRDALVHLSHSKEHSRSMGLRARELVVENHQMDRACDRIIDFVHELVSKQKTYC